MCVIGYSIPTKVVPDDLAFPVLRAALKSGANIWSGADFYGTPEENSLHLLSRYFSAYPSDAEKVILCIKSGMVDRTSMDCSAENMRRSLDRANHILKGKKFIDLFGTARVDPAVPIEKTIQGLAELVAEGKCGGILLSEVSADTIKRASKIHSISAVEAEASLWSTDIFHNDVAQTCKELSIVVLAHSPLGRGMLAGNFKTLDDVANGEFHSMFPRFQGENFEQNLKLVDGIEKLAHSKGCTSAQFALAWLRYQSCKDDMPYIVPLAGARSVQRIIENCDEIVLTEKEALEVDLILENCPVAGDRYFSAAQKLLQY